MGKKRCIGFALKMLSNLIKREADHGMQEIWQEGMTANQCRIIGYLYCNRSRDVFQKELEEYLETNLNKIFKRPFRFEFEWRSVIPPDKNGKLRMIVSEVK